MKKVLKLILIFIILLVIINLYVILTTKKRIIKTSNIEDKDFDCIVVLGAGIKNNKPSPMLEDRLLTAIELYNNKVAPKILVSGDHEYKDYDEVNVMKNYLIENGIPSEDIFMDHAGLSSYDSIYRTKKIFKADKVIIVTQKYHLYRSLYIAKSVDLNAYGVSAESTYLGEIIPIKGNGNRTNDNE